MTISTMTFDRGLRSAITLLAAARLTACALPTEVGTANLPITDRCAIKTLRPRTEPQLSSERLTEAELKHAITFDQNCRHSFVPNTLFSNPLTISAVLAPMSPLYQPPARTSWLLFLVAFIAAALFRLFPAPLTRWLRANRRHVGVFFAISHLTHLAAIITLARMDFAAFQQLTSAGFFIVAVRAILSFWQCWPLLLTERRR